MIRTYVVVYKLADQPTKSYSTRCVTSPTYGTNFESLRKMISIKRGVGVDDIEMIRVDLLTVETLEDNIAALR